MASACVNKMGMSPEKFLDCSPASKYKSYGWLSPRMSFSREFQDGGGGEASKVAGKKHTSSEGDKVEELDPDVSKDMVDFEFRALEYPVNMLPADELFSDGKLVPLHLSMIRPATTTSASVSAGVRSPDTPQLRMRNEICNADPYLFSPKAPRCTTRWRELLGLKKQQHQNNNAKQETQRTSSLPSNAAHKSLKTFLHRSSKSLSSSLDTSLHIPLLKDSDTESVSMSSRFSLSSSSSGHDHDDLPRLSLDSDKPNSFSRNANQSSNHRRVRVVKHRASSSDQNPLANRASRSPVRKQPDSTVTSVRGASVDSPRMNSSGKIVFHSLERSSSSPSTFNGGPRYKHRGMERSYSANVRVTPVLNVPVCSLRGSSKSGVFGFPLFSSSSSSSAVTANKVHHSNNRLRADRIKE